MWVEKVISLFCLSGTGVGDINKFAYVQYMEVTVAVSGVDSAFGCVCMRWATDDDLDRRLDIEKSILQARLRMTSTIA